MGSAVDDVLGAQDRGRAVGDEEADKVRDLLGGREPPERNPSQGVVDDLLRLLGRDVVADGEPIDEDVVPLGLDPAGTDGVHPDAARRELVGQSLAVRAQRALGGRVGQRRIVQRHLALDRGDVDDGPGAGIDHGRQQGSVETDRSEEVEVQLGKPLFVGCCGEAAGWGRGTASDVHQDVERALLCDPACDGRNAVDVVEVSASMQRVARRRSRPSRSRLTTSRSRPR
ncbi:MAG TPA: hypothetical protein VNS81_12745 [Nocardioides sp.]|nr:hypothetical protein [Nocardioides sp.]